MIFLPFVIFFFFQAEDGIRDWRDWSSDVCSSDLNDMGKVAIQMMAYKRDKSFILKPCVEAQFRIDPVKFYKLHTFQDNDFFEQPALLYTIIENDVPAKPLVIDAKRLKQQMFAPNQIVHQKILT